MNSTKQIQFAEANGGALRRGSRLFKKKSWPKARSANNQARPQLQGIGLQLGHYNDKSYEQTIERKTKKATQIYNKESRWKKDVTGPIQGLRHWPNQFSSPRPMAEPFAEAAGCLKKELAEGQLCKWPGKAPAARFRVATGALQWQELPTNYWEKT